MKLLIGTFHTVEVWNLPEKYFFKLKKQFPDINIVYAKNKEQILEEIKDSDIYFGWYFGKKAFENAKKIKWVHAPQIGVGRFLSLPDFKAKVLLTNASPVERRNIGEFAVSLFFGLYFNHNSIVKNYLNKQWERSEIGKLFVKKKPDLKDMTAVVVGFGGIGRVIAEVISHIVKDVIVVKRKKKNLPFRVFEFKEWGKYLPIADAIFLAIPADNSTKGFLSRKRLEFCKKKPYIINVGRGKLVCESDIAEFLKNGMIRGYATDVLENEPPEENFPLWNFDNVIISPHISALEPNFWDKQFSFFVENLQRFLEGEELMGLVI